MMKNLLIIISIIIFVTVTSYVLSSDSSKKIKRVKFTNEKVVIRNTGTEVESKIVELNSAKTNIQNTELETKNAVKQVESETYVNRTSSVEDLTFRRDYNSKNTKVSHDNNLDEYNKQRKNLDNLENRIKNPPKQNSQDDNFKAQYDEFRKQNKIPDVPDRYMDRNIDWNTWKSNFINRILDDSVYIKALDEYGLGAWFYYSFNVNSDGSITNVKVVSIHLNSKDKEQIRKLIKSYAHKPLTRFPAHTMKKSVKVDAAVMLGTTEKRSKPSDFNENEKIRIKY